MEENVGVENSGKRSEKDDKMPSPLGDWCLVMRAGLPEARDGP